MSRPDDGAGLFRSSLPQDLTDAGEPVFEEPWQAQAFAMTISLYNRGLFSWSEWTLTFSGKLAETAARGDARSYFEDWLAALETLVGTCTEVQPSALAELKQRWEQAYRTTPHGEKVVLPS